MLKEGFEMLNKLKKEKIMNLTDYIEIKKTTYITLKLTPDTSIRNYNSSGIAKSIQYMYRSLSKRIKKIEKKFIIQTPLKCSYMIDIEKNDVSFYFIVPQRYKNLIKEKITSTWSKITIEEVDNIKQFTDQATKYQLNYSKEDALSLNIDKKSNEPLNSILNVLDIMQEVDRVGIFYNFIPSEQLIWRKQYSETINKIKENKPIDREKMNLKYIFKEGLIVFINLIQDFISVVGEIFDAEIKNENSSIAELAISSLILDNKKKLSRATVNKENSIVLNTQMMVISDSNNSIRKENNAISVLESYKNISEDNELTYKKIKHNRAFNYYDYKLKNVDENKLSTDECQNLIQLPGRNLLDQHKCIKNKNVLENQISKELSDGYIRLGINEFKGDKKMAYMSSDKNLANLGLVCLGGQGCGKTEYFKNYSKDVINQGENLIILDFIKNCEFSSDVEKVVPKNKLVVVDLSKEQDLQGFGYNEIQFRNDMSDFERLETANMISQQDLALIDAINADGTPLTSRMRRYLSSAANIVHLKENTSLRDVINVLQDFRIRNDFINNIHDNLKPFLQDEINALRELDDVKQIKDKEAGQTYFEVVGTKDSKIDNILDRINLLKEDFKLKYMFNKSLEANINFVDELEQGKAILIKIPEHKFQSKYVKNTIVTYFITKIWLACQLRGRLHDKPLRTHLILDEIFQAPTSEFILQDILLQARKFQLKFIFSVHYLSKFRYIQEALKASGSSYMLLSGTDKKNYKELEEELKPFELEDLLNLKQFHSLNLIKTKQGFERFITKLPPRLNS